jgi:hypothetical protein
MVSNGARNILMGDDGKKVDNVFLEKLCACAFEPPTEYGGVQGLFGRFLDTVSFPVLQKTQKALRTVYFLWCSAVGHMDESNSKDRYPTYYVKYLLSEALFLDGNDLLPSIYSYIPMLFDYVQMDKNWEQPFIQDAICFYNFLEADIIDMEAFA